MTRSPKTRTSGRSCRVCERSRSPGWWPRRPRPCHAPQGGGPVPGRAIATGLWAWPLVLGRRLFTPRLPLSCGLSRTAGVAQTRPLTLRLKCGHHLVRAPASCTLASWAAVGEAGVLDRRLRAKSSEADPGAWPASPAPPLWVGGQGYACREGAGELACPALAPDPFPPPLEGPAPPFPRTPFPKYLGSRYLLLPPLGPCVRPLGPLYSACLPTCTGSS